MTRLNCPHCGRVGKTGRDVPPDARVRCPGCQQSFAPGSTAASTAITVDVVPVESLPRQGSPQNFPAYSSATLAPPSADFDAYGDVPPAFPTPVYANAPAPVPAAAEAALKRKRKKKVRKPGTIDRDAWVSLGVGSGLAVVALAVPLIGFVIHVLMTVIHELGHTATAWLFASPAMPSFDLSYGGGMSLILARQPLLVVAAYAVFAFFLFRARGDRPEFVKWAVAAVLYSVAMFSPLRGLLITAMGHGSELLFAGIFLYRALSGNQILRGEERPLYAFLGLFILLYDARFATGLMSSRAHREAYGDAKGGGHWMDFELIANDYLHWPLQTVAALFLFACALTPVAAFLVHRYGNRSR